jgi:cellulose synthase/poly-beta-1,6-N-acetylglucosamine synthase-like glycosyltransferase
VSAGFFRVDPHSVFEAALGATTLPLVQDVNPATFLPSSRSVAVRRSAIEQAGGYPEWLDYCEDLIFDLRLQATQPSFAFVPQAVAHFQPRPSLRSFYKQYYRYARGDGKADLWRKRHAIRYLTYLVAFPAVLGLMLFVHPLFGLLLLIGGALYTRTPYRRLPAAMAALPSVSAVDWLRALIFVPVIRVVGDVAKMIGYPVGLWWRIKNHPPEWKL